MKIFGVLAAILFCVAGIICLIPLTGAGIGGEVPAIKNGIGVYFLGKALQEWRQVMGLKTEE